MCRISRVPGYAVWNESAREREQVICREGTAGRLTEDQLNDLSEIGRCLIGSVVKMWLQNVVKMWSNRVVRALFWAHGRVSFAPLPI